MVHKAGFLSVCVIGAVLPCVGNAAVPCPPSGLSVDGGSANSVPCTSDETLSQQYPGDVGMNADADVVWMEGFESGSIASITSRYSDSNNAAGMSLDTAVPSKSRGKNALRLKSNGSGAQATDLYKNFGSQRYDELFVRYYVKYEGGVPWHHAGVTIGAQNPPMNWHEGKAGLKPNGDDRASFSIEPFAPGSTVQLDTYNYWRGMHSWKDVPSGTDAYYGNTLLHNPSAKAAGGTWVCVEIHAKLNPDPATAAGGELEVWFNDALVRRFTSTTPVGYWIRDKFCTSGTTDPECTKYYNSSLPQVPLDTRFRSSAALKLNYFWAQNYITDAAQGSVWFDDMVVAKRRIGCLK